MNRRITIDPITRLEGHGKIEIFLDDKGNVAQTFFQIPELKGFETFCVGRPAEEMTLITPRICGVCPTAHHIASARALDALYGVEPPTAGHKARELLYNLFIFEDHILHFFFLGGPDFIVGPDAPPAHRNILGVAQKVGSEVAQGLLRVRREAREIMTMMAGRAIHPVFAVPGGVTKPVSAETVAALKRVASGLVDFAAFALEAFAKIVLENRSYVDLILSDAYTHKTHSMGLLDENNHVAFYRGHLRVVDPTGAEVALFDAADYFQHIGEHVEPWSYAKFPFLKRVGWQGFTEGAASGVFRVAPLARLNVSEGMATPLAQEHYERMYATLGGKPAHQTLAYHWARLIEALQAAERVRELSDDPEMASPDVRRLPQRPPDEGVGVVEAPRGTLIHHYKTDPRGILTSVNLIVASQHNAAPIQMSVRRAAEGAIRGGVVDEAILNRVEMAFRAYDPCNACATHSLPGEMPMSVIVRDQTGRTVRTLRRDINGAVSEDCP